MGSILVRLCFKNDKTIIDSGTMNQQEAFVLIVKEIRKLGGEGYYNDAADKVQALGVDILIDNGISVQNYMDMLGIESRSIINLVMMTLIRQINK